MDLNEFSSIYTLQKIVGIINHLKACLFVFPMVLYLFWLLCRNMRKGSKIWAISKNKCCEIVPIFEFSIVLFRRISVQWMCYSFDAVCTAMWLSCYDGVCLLACQHLLVGKHWVPHVFLWQWMSDKVIILRIILIIFRMYRMRHTLCSQKRNKKHEIHAFSKRSNQVCNFHFWSCP